MSSKPDGGGGDAGGAAPGVGTASTATEPADDEPVPRLPRSWGFKVPTAALFRIGMTVALLVMILVARRPCADSVSDFVTDFDKTGSARAQMPKPGRVDMPPAVDVGSAADYEQLRPDMTEAEIKAAIARAKARAGGTGSGGAGSGGAGSDGAGSGGAGSPGAGATGSVSSSGVGAPGAGATGSASSSGVGSPGAGATGSARSSGAGSPGAGSGGVGSAGAGSGSSAAPSSAAPPSGSAASSSRP